MTVAARRSWPVMGTQVSLAVADSEMADEAARITADVLASLDARFSSYRSASEVSRFAAAEADGAGVELSRDLRHVLAACAWLEDVSGGVFSDHPGGAGTPFDVAGYVKGWAVDRAADGLLTAGIDNFALGVGGDWRTSGRRGDGGVWQFGITDPGDPLRTVATATVDGALATSGTYARGQHLLHVPGQDAGKAVPGSFSVAGPRLAWADAFATVGFLLGDDGLAWVSGFAGYTAALLRTDGTLLAHENFNVKVAAPPPTPAWAPATRAAAVTWRTVGADR